MQNKIVVGLFVLFIGILAGWYLLGNKDQVATFMNKSTPKNESGSSAPDQSLRSPSNQKTLQDSVKQSQGGGATKGGLANERTVITYTDSGFGPSTVTIAVGDTVSFVNESSHLLQVSSGPIIGVKLLASFISAKPINSGETYEYTFTQVGTWPFYNVTNERDTGVVEVR